MAQVFRNYGNEQRGPPFCVLPWVEGIELLEIDEFSEQEECPKYGDTSTWPFTYCFVLVWLPNPKAQKHGGQSRFFQSPLTPDEAEVRLNQNLARTS